MINTPPNLYSTITTASQQQIQQADLKDLSSDHAGQFFKELRLRAYVEKILAKNERYGVTSGASIVNLQTQREIVAHDLDTEHFAASVNKLPIARLVLNDLRDGKLAFDQQLTWTAADRRAGAGKFDQADAPTQASVKDLLFDMLNPSGNTAVRALVNQGLGGAAAVNDRFAHELNLQHTYLQPLEGNLFYVGYTTAREGMTNIRGLLDGDDQYRQFVTNALATNIYNDFGVRSQLADNDYIILANKVGILDDAEANNRHDVGIIYNTRTHQAYGFSLLNSSHGEAYNAPTAQAGISLADIGEGLLRFAGDKVQIQTKQHGESPVAGSERRAQELLQAPAHDGQRLIY